MPDFGLFNAFLAMLRSLPLWILAAAAAAGFAALYGPGFAGVDPSTFRHDYGTWCWLDATVFSVLAVTCAVDVVARKVSSRKQLRNKRLRSHATTRYHKIYMPLYAELMNLHLTISSTHPMRLSLRLHNAWLEMDKRKGLRRSLRNAFRDFRKSGELDESGEVDRGGTFPLGKLRQIVFGHLSLADATLVEMVATATRERWDDNAAHNYVTPSDLRLVRYIEAEHGRLKRFLAS